MTPSDTPLLPDFVRVRCPYCQMMFADRRPRPPGEAPQDNSSLPQTAAPRVQDGEKKAAMPTLDTAPRDGSSFLSCDLRFGVWSLTVRRVKFVADPSNGHMRTIDMGAWLHISGIDDDWGERDTEGDASWSIAPDDYNNPKDRVWQSLPAAPSKE